MTEEKPARDRTWQRGQNLITFGIVHGWVGNYIHALLVSFSAKLSPLVSQAIVLLSHQSSPSAAETRHG